MSSSDAAPSSARQTLDPAAAVTDAVARVQRATYQLGNLRLRPWKVTLPSYVALSVMSDLPDLTLAQLSRRCFVRPQTMTRMVTQLEKRGFVERQARPEDVRALSLRLSQNGESLLGSMGEEVNRIADSINTALNGQEIEQLNDLLRRCARQLEADLSSEFPDHSF